MGVFRRSWLAAILITATAACNDADRSNSSAASSRPASSATQTTLTEPSSTTSRPSTSVLDPPPTTAPATRLRVMPLGARSEFDSFRIIEANIESFPDSAVDEVALTYDLQIGFFPDGHTFAVEAPPATDDGQLAIEVECTTDDCASLPPVNDAIETTIRLTVWPTTAMLTTGEHEATLRLRFDDGAVHEFAVVLFVEPAPSAAIADLVTRSTGAPARVQTVFDVGKFADHMVSAFDSIWVLGKLSHTVTRIDAITGEVLASIPLTLPSTGGLNRLAAASDAVYVAGSPLVRIDPATNEVTAIPGAEPAAAIVAEGAVVWTAGLNGPIQRIDADGTITDLGVPPDPWVDLAFSNGLVWAVSQARGRGHLIAFDGATGEIVHDLPVATDVNGFAVSLVADERSVVVGVDTSGGGGRTGELLIIDPTTAALTATVPLASRPEGIVLTDRHIWTSYAVLDRTSLAVTEVVLGFAITLGPDGSLWATNGVSGSGDGRSIATRTAPGDFAG